MNCVWGVTKVFLASSPPRRRWPSVGGWSWCTGSTACQRTGRWCHRSWRSSAWPRPCSRRLSWRSALRRSSSRPNTGWTSAPWASTPGMFPPYPHLSSQLSTLNSWISLLKTQHVFFLWHQREAGPGLLRGGAAHEGLRLQLHPCRRHDVLRRHAHSE